LTDPISLKRGIGPECFGTITNIIRGIARNMCAQDESVDVAIVATYVGMPRDFVAAILSEAALIT
jgi:hypothetical protein